MQAQQDMQQAAHNSPMQKPLNLEVPQSSQGSPGPAVHSNADDLMRDAAEAMHQVRHMASAACYDQVYNVMMPRSVGVTCM